MLPSLRCGTIRDAKRDGRFAGNTACSVQVFFLQVGHMPTHHVLRVTLQCVARSVTSLMPLYLRNSLGYSEPGAVAVGSYFNSLVYFSPLLGGWLADSYLGKYKVRAISRSLRQREVLLLNLMIASQTIVGFLSVYIFGIVALALAALTSNRGLVFASLLVIAAGSGGR